MNKIIDSNGKAIFFGDDFLIKESFDGGFTDLTLYCAGEKHVIALVKGSFSFSGMLPGTRINDFTNLKLKENT